MKKYSFPVVLAGLFALPVSMVAAQNFPTRPVRMIVPLAVGGPVDTVGRIVALQLSEQMKHQVVVDNRPGAGGSVGGEMLARAAPDGHTILMAANGTIAIAPHLITKLPFDAMKDFAPITLVGTSPQAMLLHLAVPAKTVKEFIDLARSKPGSVNFASSGAGSTSHLASELLMMMAKISMVHVPYKGAGPALTDLMGGQTQMMITGISSALPFITGGKLRAIGVTSTKRVSVLPEAPPISETVPGYEVTTWYALYTTAKTPAPIIAALNRESVKAVNTPEIKARLTAAGVEAETSTPEQLAKMGREEVAKWGKLISAIGLKAQ